MPGADFDQFENASAAHDVTLCFAIVCDADRTSPRCDSPAPILHPSLAVPFALWHWGRNSFPVSLPFYMYRP